MVELPELYLDCGVSVVTLHGIEAGPLFVSAGIRILLICKLN